MNINQELIEKWRVLKQAEKAAQTQRQDLEDSIRAELNIPDDFVGTFRYGNLKFTVSKTYKVLSRVLDKLKGLDEDEVARVIKWEPKLDSKEWKECPYEPVAEAIEVKLGRATCTWEI